MNKSDKTREAAVADRRNFLKLVGASAVGGGVVVAAGAAVAAPASEQPATGGDYRESEHVKRFYALSREF